VTKPTYTPPTVRTLEAAEIQEILGPAQGYGAGGGSATQISNPAGAADVTGLAKR